MSSTKMSSILAAILAASGVANALHLHGRCASDDCTVDCTRPGPGLQFKKSSKSYLNMDWRMIHLTPDEESRYGKDYATMLWLGKPFGLCTCLPKEFMKNRLRAGFLLGREHPRGSLASGLPQGFQKASVLESASERPPEGAVAFIGSSTFTYWRTLQRDFSGWQTYNAAFGGSITGQQIVPDLFKRLVVQHKPSQIVFYCGTNDVAGGIKAEEVRDHFATWHKMVRSDLGPGVRIVYLAIGVTPNYLSWEDSIIPEEAYRSNRLMSEYCANAGDPRLVFVNNNQPFVKDPAFYLRDEHHLNLEGHRRLAAVIKPFLAPP